MVTGGHGRLYSAMEKIWSRLERHEEVAQAADGFYKRRGCEFSTMPFIIVQNVLLILRRPSTLPLRTRVRDTACRHGNDLGSLIPLSYLLSQGLTTIPSRVRLTQIPLGSIILHPSYDLLLT
jgi:hypothetical protein